MYQQNDASTLLNDGRVFSSYSQQYLVIPYAHQSENAEKELFGEERMLKELKKMEDKTAKEQNDKMVQAVHKHVNGAEQSDDLTMFTTKYNSLERDTKFYCKITIHNDIREIPKMIDFMDDIVGETGTDKVECERVNGNNVLTMSKALNSK